MANELIDELVGWRMGRLVGGLVDWWVGRLASGWMGRWGRGGGGGLSQEASKRTCHWSEWLPR